MAKEKAWQRVTRRPQRRCLFCDGLPLSDEHLFADWIRKLVPPGEPQRFQKKSASSAILSIAGQPTIYKKPGNLLSKRVRVVCKLCNETWMGMIETSAIPVMTPLILGESAKLSASDQQAIAMWATLKTIIGEQRDPQSAQIPVESIKEFFRTRTVLSGWQIWIGQYVTGTWNARYAHKGGSFVLPARTPSGLIYNDKGQLQTSTFIFGKALIHVCSSTMPFPYHIKHGLVRYMHIVLPATTVDILWPPSPSIADGEVEQIINSINSGRYI
jgi:hypothetical protein